MDLLQQIMSLKCCNFLSWLALSGLFASVVFRVIATAIFVFKDPSSQVIVTSVTGVSCIPDVITIIVGGIGVKRQASGCLVSAAVVLVLPLIILVGGAIVINFVSQDWKIIVEHVSGQITEDILMVAAYASGIASESLTALILVLDSRSIRKHHENEERKQLRERDAKRQRRQLQVSLVQQHQRVRVGSDLIVPKDPTEEDVRKY